MKVSIKARIGADLQQTIFLDGPAADVLTTLGRMGQLDHKTDAPSPRDPLDWRHPPLAIYPDGKRTTTIDTKRASVETNGRVTTVHVDSLKARNDLIDAFLYFRQGKRIMAVSTPDSVPVAVQDSAIRGGFASGGSAYDATHVPNRHELTIVCGGTTVGRFTFNSMPEGAGLTFGTGKPVADGFQAWLDTVLAEIAARMNYARGDLHARMSPKRDTYTLNNGKPAAPSPHPAMAHVEEQEDRTREALRAFAERRPPFVGGSHPTTSPRAG